MRSIKNILDAGKHPIGENFMFQPLPNRLFSDLDPFLLLHHHGPHTFEPYNQGLPFGPHPHRGFETLTLIYEGEIEHADSQGFRSIIKPGGIQWMTAGRGIVHSENLSESMREDGGRMEIVQLWLNLPARLKMTTPTYQGFQADEIPKVLSTDGKIETQVVAGEFRGIKAPTKSLTALSIFKIWAAAQGVEQYEPAADTEILLYVLNGQAEINGTAVSSHQLVQFSHEPGTIQIHAKTGTHLILASGKPLQEPIVAQGPFVMNTSTEILQAMRDYQMGKMGLM